MAYKLIGTLPSLQKNVPSIQPEVAPYQENMRLQPIVDQQEQQVEPRPLEPESESFLGQIKHAALPVIKPVAAAISGAASGPSGLVKAGLWGASKVAQLFGGSPEDIPSYEEIQEKGGVIGHALRAFPTEEQWKGAIGKIINEDLTPTSDTEEGIQNVASMVGALTSAGVKPLAQAAIIGTGKAAKRITKFFGGGSEAQAIAEAGVGLGTSLISHRLSAGSKKALDARYNKAYAHLPEGEVLIPAKKLAEDARKIKNQMGKIKTGVPEYEAIYSKAEELLKKNIKNVGSKGKKKLAIDVRDAVNFKQSVNKISGMRKEFSPKFDKLREITTAAVQRGTFRKYPEFWDKFYEADRVYEAVHDSAALANLMKEHKIDELIQNKPIKYILCGGGIGSLIGGYSLAGVPGVAAVGGIAGYLHELHKAADMIIKNPTMRLEYIKILKANKAGKANVVAHYAKKLDSDYSKERGSYGGGYKRLR